jgi:nucleoside-diphosphate-sugar epimerase
MKILVTGAAGFLGYHIARTLSDRADTQVVCADNGIRGEFDPLYAALVARPNVTSVKLDLNELQNLAALPDDVDVIYHMAALNGTQNFYERPFEVVRCCTLPTLNLLQKYAPLGRLKRFVYAGTSESYASTVTRFGWPVPTAEDVPLGIDDVFNPRWSYAAGKMHGEIATITGCNQYKLDFTIIRFHNAYGPRMGDKHVVPDFYNRARQGKFELYGYEDTRSFIYVDDAVRATLALGEADSAKGQVVNIGGTREITMLDLGKIMMQVAGFEGEIALHPSPKGSVKRRCPDVSKLKALTGFTEEWSLEDGLKATAAFYLA